MKKLALTGGLLGFVAVLGVAWMIQGIGRRVQGEYFDSAGVKIHYTVEGAGAPLLLIHGFCANADLNFRRPGITKKLAEKYRVISIDNRGHGLSEKPLERNQYGVEMVRDQIRLLDHLKIEKAYIVGYSMGSFITLKLLTMHPERVIAAAAMGAGLEPRDDVFVERLAKSLESGQGYRPLIERLEPGGNPGWFKRWSMNKGLTKANNANAMAQVARSLVDLQATEAELRAIPVPVLSVVGSKDPLKRGVDALVGIIPDYTVVVVEGDHITTIGRRELIDGLLDFLESHPPAAAAIANKQALAPAA